MDEHERFFYRMSVPSWDPYDACPTELQLLTYPPHESLHREYQSTDLALALDDFLAADNDLSRSFSSHPRVRIEESTQKQSTSHTNNESMQSDCEGACTHEFQLCASIPQRAGERCLPLALYADAFSIPPAKDCFFLAGAGACTRIEQYRRPVTQDFLLHRSRKRAAMDCIATTC